MAQWLTLSRAAHLTGMTRGALQKKIREGDLPSFDGMVSTEDLFRAFPDTDIARQLDDGGAFERIARIKDEAFGKRVRERVLPSQETLAQRLFAQGTELAELRRHLARYHALVVATQSQLAALRNTAPAIDAIAQSVDRGLAAILGSATEQDTFALMDDMLRVISARVTLRPSGREFLVEGNDTLLEAALKAGISPNYGCGNGNCGLCKARVIAGEVKRIRPTDYAFSQAEQQQGHVLMCAHTAITDVTIETLEAGAPEDIPTQEIVATVRAIKPLTDDVWLLHLQTPRSHRLRFLAGQGVTLGLAGGTADFSADYPIASCPCDDRNLHFHVRRTAGDDFAARLFAGALRTGEAVDVRGPWGDFVIAHDAERPLIFLAAGNGFAPIKSLIEHAMAAQTCESITLVWSAAAGGHYLANQCRAWAEALDDFRYVQLDAGEDAQSADAVSSALRAAGGAPEVADVYAAGPPDYIERLHALLGPTLTRSMPV